MTLFLYRDQYISLLLKLVVSDGVTLNHISHFMLLISQTFPNIRKCVCVDI